MGEYPEVSLSDARARRDEAKRGIAGGSDPGKAKQEEKLAQEAQVKFLRLYHAFFV
ncbi:DUF4102 domain-containing protein [Jejubacter calystegiae]|uniref:DUF4102 domain-containing protein n=1 Tax=Jejubacter calystegiae TaxID=2579935 RepID=A0A4P8YN86_9ENTR|nr:DUF4102 domain-containing protein [Jejubacter calystegiae]